jgi:hypothetical protein
MEKKFKLLPPTGSMPNFIFFEVQPGKRQEGFQPNKNSIPVTDLDEQEAEEYAELMKQTFLDHWRRKKTSDTR